MYSHRIFRAILSLALLLTLSGFTLKACTRAPVEATKPVTLNWWRVFDDTDTVAPAIDAFKKLHPNITVNYRRLRFEEYEEELVNALAEDSGPDILSLHNTWITKYQQKLLPSPASLTLPFTFIKGSIKKEVVTELRKVPVLSPQAVRNQYLDVVGNDVIRPEIVTPNEPPQEKIIALPLSVDTLALYYNRDLLNASGIPEPARVWSALQEQVKRLTKTQSSAILQAGVALGTSVNVPRATDILSLLMMQNGAEMTDDRGFATFDRIPAHLNDRQVAPADEALAFYTDFANPAKEVYTWNATLPDALELFIQGRLAYFFGYSYHLPLIRARAPKLRFGVTRMPQIEENPEVNFANYWVEAVTKKTKNPNEAWGFLQFLAEEKQVREYLTRAGRPPALRALIPEWSEDANLGIFTQQLLTAKSWYRGLNPAGAERIINEMIDTVARGEEEIPRVIQRAVSRINQTIR